jgi:serine/threonine protein kinase
MPKVIDKYVLEESIGKGQFGEVFRGKHQETLEEVAIKSICRDKIQGNCPLI